MPPPAPRPALRAPDTARADVLVAVAGTVALVAAFLMPGDNIRGLEPSWLPKSTDKAVHAGLFLIETVLLARAFRHRSAKPLAASVLSAALLGLATEIAQNWVPFRATDPADLAADGLGVALAAIWLARRARAHRLSRASEEP